MTKVVILETVTQLSFVAKLSVLPSVLTASISRVSLKLVADHHYHTLQFFVSIAPSSEPVAKLDQLCVVACL